jgi:hypothetical protein
MKELLNDVEMVVIQELARANKMFPSFQSPHEAYGVIKEEQEKAADENCSTVGLLNDFWNAVKSNDYEEQEAVLNSLRDAAVRAAAELCQVAAMAQKGIDSLYQYKTVKGRSNENKN